jgi:hypothetical protein
MWSLTFFSFGNCNQVPKAGSKFVVISQPTRLFTWTNVIPITNIGNAIRLSCPVLKYIWTNNHDLLLLRLVSYDNLFVAFCFKILDFRCFLLFFSLIFVNWCIPCLLILSYSLFLRLFICSFNKLLF